MVYYSLVITYENQNYSAMLLGCYSYMHELELDKLRFFQNQLNCHTIDKMISELESGYFIHIKILADIEYLTVNKFIEKYFNDELGAVVLDNSTDKTFKSPKGTKRILKIVL